MNYLSRNPPCAGAELKKLLAKFCIISGADCVCDAHAAEMDARGPSWCRANIELICDWLQESARQCKLPFVRAAARLLVRRAIRNTERRVQTPGNPVSSPLQIPAQSTPKNSNL